MGVPKTIGGTVEGIIITGRGVQANKDHGRQQEKKGICSLRCVVYIPETKTNEEIVLETVTHLTSCSNTRNNYSTKVLIMGLN